MANWCYGKMTVSGRKEKMKQERSTIRLNKKILSYNN